MEPNPWVSNAQSYVHAGRLSTAQVWIINNIDIFHKLEANVFILWDEDTSISASIIESITRCTIKEQIRNQIYFPVEVIILHRQTKGSVIVNIEGYSVVGSTNCINCTAKVR